MLLSEFKEYLAYGELSQLSVGELFEDPRNLQKLVSHINFGLIELHKRFPIKFSKVILQLAEDRTEYVIHSRVARSKMEEGDDEVDFYLVDSINDPFKDDIVQITEVFNVDGTELPLNDNNDTTSLFTFSYNVLHHPYPDTNLLTVQYRGLPSKLSMDSGDDIDIDLPQAYVEALANYVAYRSFSGMNMNTAESVNYYAKFEASCALLNNLGLTHKVNDTNLKATNNGWV